MIVTLSFIIANAACFYIGYCVAVGRWRRRYNQVVEVAAILMAAIIAELDHRQQQSRDDSKSADWWKHQD